MRKFISTSLFTLLTVAPAIAAASPAGGESAAPAGVAGALAAGCSVVMYTGGRNYRYDLTRWGQVDQGCTMPITTEAAVRSSLARREATARAQGVRPGTLATARQELLAQSSSLRVH